MISPTGLSGEHRPGSAKGDAWLTAAAALYLIATTVSFATTALSSRAFIEPIRVLAIGGVLGIVVVCFLRRRRVSGSTVVALALYAAVVCYGLTLAAAHGGFRHVQQQLVSDVALAAVGIYLVSSLGTRILPAGAALIFLTFAMTIFAATIAVGGFTAIYPPRFILEYGAVQSGAQIYYSQGVSKFFGLAAVAAVFVGFSAKSRAASIGFYLVCIVCLSLSLLGGARGDSVAAAGVVFFYSWFRSHKSLWVWMVAGIAALVILPGVVVFDDFIIFSRLSDLQSGAGIRELLFKQAIGLLVEQPGCLLRGCGFGYFQFYYDYDSGLYPHNIAVESVIALGLPLVLLLGLLAVRGLVAYAKRERQLDNAFLLFYVYFVLLSMKSGTLLGAWFLTAGTFYFIAFGLCDFVRGTGLRLAVVPPDRISQ